MKVIGGLAKEQRTTSLTLFLGDDDLDEAPKKETKKKGFLET